MDTAHERFDRLFEAYETALRAYCARRVAQDVVDDVVNDTFSVVWRKIDLAPDGADGLPWLYAVAYRVICHQWRSDARYARLRERTAAIGDPVPPSVADRVVETEHRRRVLEAAADLAESDQEILRLTLWEELPPADAAVVLEITPAAARQRASRARRRLASRFRELEGETSGWARPVTSTSEGTAS